MSTTITLYPLSNFTFSTKEAQPEEDPSVQARLQRLQNNYEDFGMRRTVEGVLVVHDHGHPHILMLQIANAFFKLCASSPSLIPLLRRDALTSLF
ncbi:hypothetical protein FS837_008216 [Tulasnella sp. UAMH 9824]|nr:hypothetical protein FS837_008216 [Tulasnella sp. UAMH 9824]